MIRIILSFIMIFSCTSLFALNTSAVTTSQFQICPQAVPTSNANFCASFKSVASCQCVNRGLPKGMCQDMKLLYSRMISMFGTIQRACQYQHDTTLATCMNDWSCYRNGGKDSTGALCSGTGRAC